MYIIIILEINSIYHLALLYQGLSSFFKQAEKERTVSLFSIHYTLREIHTGVRKSEYLF